VAERQPGARGKIFSPKALSLSAGKWFGGAAAARGWLGGGGQKGWGEGLPCA